MHGILNSYSLTSGKEASTICTPDAINQLIAYFVNKENCQSVFDPFCGSSLIASYLHAPEFIGQDLSPIAHITSEIILDAINTKTHRIFEDNSIINWVNSKVDAIITCPPLNMNINLEHIWSDRGAIKSQSKTVEELLVRRSLNINGAKIVCFVSTTGFCYNSKFEQLRKELVENNYLDTIIFLPSNIMYGTSVPTVLVICKRNRGFNSPVNLFNANELYNAKNRLKTFDIDSFMKLYSQASCEKRIMADIESIRSFDYSLNFDIYSQLTRELKTGQKRVKLCDILEKVSGISCDTKTAEASIATKNTSSNFIEILLNKNKVTKEENKKLSTYKLYSGEGAYLLNTRGGIQVKAKYALHTDGQPFMCLANMEVWKINTQFVTPEYLAYKLTMDEMTKRCNMPFSSYAKVPIIIESLEAQKTLVAKIIQEYNVKSKAEQEADAKRLGIKRNISDLEHMLGTTQFKINQMLGRLERMTPESANYSSTVKALKDNFEYMNRQIHYTNGKIDKDSFNLKEAYLSEFIDKYVDCWNNYGGNYFTLEVVNRLQGHDKIHMDANMLTVLLDAILSNAIRHSFHKRKNYTRNNLVELSLELVEYHGKAFIKLGIANNGDPIKEGFTINDYISRGKFTPETGRSGLGGYQVYEIVKGHDGYLNIDSNSNWNVIINILLPIEVNDTLTLSAYEQECI